MTVAKVKLNEPLYPKYLKVNKRALVIGGGIAGMTAALEIARQGYEVHLVEKEGELGGLARRIKYTLEGDIQALLKKTKKEVKENKKIKVHLNSEVSEIEGSVGNFRTTIKTKGKQKTIEHGVVILATGAKEHVPQEYLYGKNGNVLTQLELEEKLANGGLAAKNFVMIQCVGSREAPREYCSRVCCSEAIKNGLKIKELDPEAEVYVLHRDVRTYGFYEKFYREAREKGIKFIRYDGGKPEVTMENGGLMVSVHDMLLDTKVDLRPDVLVLSSAIEANELNKDLSQKLKVPLTQDGFFLEAHMKLRPIDFATEGMFVCGTAHGPKTTYETIAQAMAAATRASTILSKDELEIDPRISEVIDENCDGCAYCIEPCPFDAVTLIEYMREGAVKKTVEVDISKCQGCGTCVATCPKKGIEVKNFRMEQLAAMIEAALVRE
jgi:heterodisulfide reductase subunit A